MAGFHTFTGVCVAERLLSVQAYADISSTGRWWITAGSSPLVVSAPTAHWALGPGRPTRPGSIHWQTQIIHYTSCNVYIPILPPPTDSSYLDRAECCSPDTPLGIPHRCLGWSYPLQSSSYVFGCESLWNTAESSWTTFPIIPSEHPGAETEFAH